MKILEAVQLRTSLERISGCSRRLEVFLACALLNLAPLLYFRFVPSNDGPTHVYNAAMLRLFWFAPGGPASNTFAWNTALPPNLLTHSALALLISVLSPVTAERVLVLSYALLLPIAFRYFLRSVSSRTYGLEFLSLAFVYSSHLHWGFYNFLFSLVLFLVATGYWIHNRHNASFRSIATLTFFSVLLYFSHPVGLIEFWIVCGAITVYERFGEKGSWSGLKLLSPALLISGALYLHYSLARIPSPGEFTDWPTVRYAASLLLTFSPLASYSVWQRVIALAIPLLLFALAAVVLKRERFAALVNPYAFAAIITAGIVLIAPSSTGGGTMLTPRLVYAPVVLACAWLITREWQFDIGKVIPVFGITLAFAMILSNWAYYSRYNARMQQFMATEANWPQDGYLLFRPDGPATLLLDNSRTPFISSAAAGYLAAERGQVLLGDYQAIEGYFPLRYKPTIPKTLYSSVAHNLCPEKTLETEATSASTPIPLHAAVFVVAEHSPEASHCFSFPPSAQFDVSGISFVYYRWSSHDDALSMLK